MEILVSQPFGAVELLALSAGVGFQMILIGILTAMLWLAGIAAIFISLGIALLSREFPKAHFLCCDLSFFICGGSDSHCLYSCKLEVYINVTTRI